ncbi:NADH-ubiquinone oxidoreductase chain 4 [Gryllus bimaculatus]|nr:NADH-ubiquinone oxidoreductase chain 4 [Gryllus bimaculatus]
MKLHIEGFWGDEINNLYMFKLVLKLGGYGLMHVFRIIGVILGGLMTLNSSGFCHCCLIIIGHGLCSSGLFCLSKIVYK